MAKEIFITQISGERELFDEQKLSSSLSKSGAELEVCDRIVAVIEKGLYDGMPTKEIYRRAFYLLRREAPAFAARYNLKKAIFALGPTGFPFERYVAELLKADGYSAQVGQIVKGYCVSHEIDVVAQKGGEHFLVEAKYHHEQGLRTDVKVALYVQARFEDIRKYLESKEGHSLGHEFHQAWLITNTKFTSEAIAYGECMGIRMIGWGYPEGKGLEAMIERLRLHPITALTTISGANKNLLFEQGVVLCKDVHEKKEALKGIGLSNQAITRLAEEAKNICEQIPNI
jgi:hypothetical protein